MADEDETPPHEFLRDLAEKLMHIPGTYGTDQYHADRCREIASSLEPAPTPALSLYQKLVRVAEAAGFVSDDVKDMLEEAAGMVQQDPRSEEPEEEFFDDPNGAICPHCEERSDDPNHAANCGPLDDEGEDE